MRRATSNVDEMVGRLGGEEFALILQGRSLNEAIEAAEAIRRSIASLIFSGTGGSFQITCSLGVSEFRAGDSIDQLLRRADAALYQAKTQGRNRVIAVTSDDVDAGSGSGTLRAAGSARDIPRS